jgi:heme oxygenase
MNDAQESIMRRLKADTRELHSHAESRSLQRAIASGSVDREAFTSYLGQLYRVHSSLESALQESTDKHPAIAAVATSERMHVPELERDLGYFEIDHDEVKTGEATAHFVSQIEETKKANPIALLGALYVLEGSTNGGRFLARTLRQSWELDDDGISYFDPYGEEQPQRWAAFKRDMDGAGFDGNQQESILEMAKTTFLAIAQIADEVAGSSS